jgi:hypothetical protein
VIPFCIPVLNSDSTYKFSDNVVIGPQSIGLQVLLHTLLLISLQTTVNWIPLQVGLARHYHCKSMILNVQVTSPSDTLRMTITIHLTNLMLFNITQTTTMQRLHRGRYALEPCFFWRNGELTSHLQYVSRPRKIGRKQYKMNGSFYREIYQVGTYLYIW